MFIGKSMAIHFAVCSEKGQEVNSQKGGDLGGGWAGEEPVGPTVGPLGPTIVSCLSHASPSFLCMQRVRRFMSRIYRWSALGLIPTSSCLGFTGSQS